MSEEMKKLVIGEDEFEIVDENARQRIIALEEGTVVGGGLSSIEKSLILQLFEKAAYSESNASTAYDSLQSLWSHAAHYITWNGVGYSKSNSHLLIEDGDSYTSTVSADTGFTIDSVTVTMGGVTMQGAYSNGTITIPNVTGDIVITVTTTQLTVSSISAVYTQSGTVYDTDSLDSLKSDLVVTATFMDSSTGVIDANYYTLSGTLTEGTSTITVSYGGKTDTFTVTVTENVVITYENGAISGTGVESDSTTRIRTIDYIPVSGSVPMALRVGDTSEDSTSLDTVNARIGGISSANGSEIENTARLSTQWIKMRRPETYPNTNQTLTITCINGYYMKVFEYNANKELMGTSIGDLTTASISGILNATAHYIKIVFKKSDNADFTTEELSATRLSITGFTIDFNMQTSNAVPIVLMARAYDNNKSFISAFSIIDFREINGHHDVGGMGWIWSNISYFVPTLPTGTKYIRLIGRNQADTDVPDATGTVTVDDVVYNVAFE